MNFKKKLPANHQNWLKLRSLGIGGSDAGIIIGVNKYKNVIDLWEEKKKSASSECIEEFTSEATERGKKLEDIIRKQYKIDNPDKKIYEIKDLYIHKDFDFIRASLDGEIVLKNNKVGILEIKTSTIHSYTQFIENWKNNIPKSYLYQILHYLLVTNYEFAVLVADLRFKYRETDEFDLYKEIRTYTIYRNDFKKEIEELKEKEIEFWSYVVNDIEPPYIKNLII
jgi:putative phage-type endonuclease